MIESEGSVICNTSRKTLLTGNCLPTFRANTAHLKTSRHLRVGKMAQKLVNKISGAWTHLEGAVFPRLVLQFRLKHRKTF